MEVEPGNMKADRSQSLPNMGESLSVGPEEKQQPHCYSLSQLKKHTEFASDFHHKPSPYFTHWIYGYNAKAGVINLNDQGSTIVFYAASNCGVLYNWTTNEMRILQGHKNMVTCIAADNKGKWLVTADSGPENIITVWDSQEYYPHRTWFSPHGTAKLSKLALSADAKYLLTLGYHDKASLHWWIWSFGQDQPHATLEVDIPRDSVVAMNFNPENSIQFVLLTKQDIWIGISAKVFVFERGIWRETDSYELKIRKPERTLSPEVGRLTCFTFVKETSQVLVGTGRGAVLVYSYTIDYQENVVNTNDENLRYVKAFKLSDHRLNVIKNVDGLVVTGNCVGEIRFYDTQMKMLYWVHGFRPDSIKGLCFNLSPRSYQILDPKCGKRCPCWEKVEKQVDPDTGVIKQKLLKKRIPEDATTGNKRFLVRDFIVCTYNQGVGFVDFVTEKLGIIMDYKKSYAMALTVHPEKSLICVGFADGLVELTNFVQHKLFARLDLRQHFTIITPPDKDSIKGNIEIFVPKLSVSCLKYSPSGLHLACGLNTGELLFLDPTTIDILTTKPHHDTSHAIQRLTYSEDSLTLAMADAGRTVCVYKYDCQNFIWQFIGKHRSHYKDITDLFFTPTKNKDGEYKLLSFGVDRIMVEYDIGNSSNEYLEILSIDRVDQSAVPLAGILWPTPEDIDPEVCRTDIAMILIANDEHKYKIVNYNTAMTLNTVLGPRFEHPVNKMHLTACVEGKQYLLFATKNLIGLQKLPLDGNPWKHAAMLGHPIQILEICFREDTGNLFTIGAKDSCISQWAAHYRTVDATTKLGGIELDPYYCILEDGRPGWLFQEIRDLFYYIQILCQGTFTPAMRKVKDYIPIESLPDLMRALGFFPSEYEVENLIIEAKYKVYQRHPAAEIDFEEFVKLYLNHRPAFGDNMTRVRNAFRTFASFHNESYAMSRDGFLHMLSNYGERFPGQLSWYLLSVLCGHTFEDRALIPEQDFFFLPEIITFSELVSNILGIQDVENLSEQRSTIGSLASQQTASSVTTQSEER